MTEIEVRVAELTQLFNPIDSAPMRTRDLAPRVEEFIIGWAKDLPPDTPLGLVVHVDTPLGDTAYIGEAVHEFFRQKARGERRQLKELFHRGRISLVIGIAFLALTLVLSKLLEAWPTGSMIDVLRTSLAIAGWVGMWRPMELFLYDWWPILAQARLSERLAAMPVRVST
jgi:hypothetical protein